MSAPGRWHCQDLSGSHDAWLLAGQRIVGKLMRRRPSFAGCNRGPQISSKRAACARWCTKSKLLTTGMIGRCGRVISSFVIATIGSFQHSIFAVNIPMMHVGVMATPLLANLFSRFRFRSGTYRLSVVRSGRKTARSTHAPILVSSNLNQIGHTDSGTMRRRISGYAKASRNAALARPTANVGNMRRPSASMQLVRSRVCIW